MPQKLDLTGQRFGSWTVIEYSHNNKYHRMWLCQCNCGIQKPVQQSHLRDGRSTGCFNCRPKGINSSAYKHGGKTLHAETYRIWKAMRNRCNNPNDSHYHRYGGRGIKICDRWNNFELFLLDMGSRPSPSLQIDRIDNDKGYSPGNCRWATPSEQQRNTSRTHFITMEGQTRCLTEWAEIKGINPKTVRGRLSKGLSYAEAFNTPVKRLGRRCRQNP
jgi:hypothetical protein